MPVPRASGRTRSNGLGLLGREKLGWVRRRARGVDPILPLPPNCWSFFFLLFPFLCVSTISFSESFHSARLCHPNQRNRLTHLHPFNSQLGTLLHSPHHLFSLSLFKVVFALLQEGILCFYRLWNLFFYRVILQFYTCCVLFPRLASIERFRKATFEGRYTGAVCSSIAFSLALSMAQAGEEGQPCLLCQPTSF